MMENKGTALAVFDFDGTMIAGDSILAYLRTAYRLGALPKGECFGILLSAVPWLFKKKTDAALKTRALQFYFSLPAERQMALDRAFAEEELLPRIYPDAKKQLAGEKEAGKWTILLSASTENYMRHVADALGFEALICTKLENGAVLHNCKGEEKLRRLDKWIQEQGIHVDYSGSVAYGDSRSDLGILRRCGQGYAVNPKKALRRAAPDLPVLRWRKLPGD